QLLPPLSPLHAPAAPPLYTLSLHDALPISSRGVRLPRRPGTRHPLAPPAPPRHADERALPRSGRHARVHRTEGVTASVVIPTRKDRKSTRLNSSHVSISYAVFCLKKKKKQK